MRWAVAIASIAPAYAGAQSQVQLFGYLDAGVSYISNQGGKHNWKMDDGIAVPNLLGFRGREELGQDTAAVFQLMSQFTLSDGRIIAQASNGSGTGTGLFARNAWVGLDNKQYGKLTFGRQYDFMVDTLFFDVGADIAMYGGGFYAFRDGPFAKLGIPDSPPNEAFDFDHMNGDTPLNSSVKYTSPAWGGLRFGGMYAFGGTAGNFRQNSGDSFGVSYQAGPLAVGAAYTDIRYASLQGESIRNYGVGGRYRAGDLLLTALFTSTRNSANGAMVNVAQGGILYQLTAPVSASLAYAYMWGNAAVDRNHANQVTAVLKYHFSKRTAVYAQGVYQLTNRGATAAINGTFGPSDGRSQMIGRIGVQTSF